MVALMQDVAKVVVKLVASPCAGELGGLPQQEPKVHGSYKRQQVPTTTVGVEDPETRSAKGEEVEAAHRNGEVDPGRAEVELAKRLILQICLSPRCHCRTG